MNVYDEEVIKRYKRYEKMFTSLNDIVLFYDRDGKVCERSDAVERELSYLPDEDIYVQDIFRSAFEVTDGEIKVSPKIDRERFETVAYRKNQTCLSVYVSVVELGEDTGCYGMCYARNIARQKEATKELMSAQVEVEEVHKERNELVANVTHELRTPVNGVLGLAQNLLETNLDSEQRESVEIISQCCNNMIKIINNILDYSKLQSGKFTIENGEFSFHKMMDKMMKVNTPQVEAKGLKLICNVSEDIPDIVVGDELRITQILNNLLSNAIKFTSVGQIVVNVVKTMDIDDNIEIFFMVIDSGIGIAENEMDKLFKSFSQVDASITRRFGGTGLGLSIVKSLVEMMGGNINVESEKGKGSTFSFSVKLKKPTSQPAIETTGAASRESYSFNFGSADDDMEEEESEIYKIGSDENRKQIKENMEKLVICIEMENWDRANSFAENVKQLVQEDAMNLKRKAFRLQMTVRKGDHDSSISQYEELKAAIDEKFSSAVEE